MASIKLKFRVPSDLKKEGTLYFQIIHNRVVRQIKTNHRIFLNEWNEKKNCIVNENSTSPQRSEQLKSVRKGINREKQRLMCAINELSTSCNIFSADDVVERYLRNESKTNTFFGYMKNQIESLRRKGKERTSECYYATLRSFMKFRNNIDMYIHDITAEIVECYEAYLRQNNLCRNSSSFNLRILRSAYNKAVKDGFAVQNSPFANVYTGVDKTSKRAITIKEIKRIKELDLHKQKTCELARDIFLFSFYMRGMSFIDIAYLRKSNLSNGYITYNRMKTGQQLTIRWEKHMQEIVDKYDTSGTPYLLPIILKEDGTERKQYLNKMLLINRKLKIIAKEAGITIPLSLYVARHSWASIARDKNIPIAIISKGMGHDSENTTQIYLSSIQSNKIDEANGRILRGL